jgi:hypothetical protein
MTRRGSSKKGKNKLGTKKSRTSIDLGSWTLSEGCG